MRKAWEIFLKKNQQECYSSDQVGDFKYIAEDLSPDYFICDGDTINSEWDHFKRVVGESEILKSTPIITIGNRFKEPEALKLFKHFDKPFHLMTTYQSIIAKSEES